MRLEDFVYRVALRTLELLEREAGYRVSPETKRKIAEDVRAETAELSKDA